MTGTAPPSGLILATDQTQPTTVFRWVASTMTDDPTRGVGDAVEVAFVAPQLIRFFDSAGSPTGVVPGGSPLTVTVDFGRPAVQPVTASISGRVSRATCNDPDFAAVPSWFPASVTLPAGQQVASFVIQTQPLDCLTEILIQALQSVGTLGYVKQELATFAVSP